MFVHRITAKTLFAVLIANFAALIAREILRARLVASGYQADYAADLSYLVMPLVLLILLFPLWRTEKGYLLSQFRLAALNWRLVLTALAIGVLIRATWWCQLIAGVSFGFYFDAGAQTVASPLFRFACPAPAIIGTGLFAMAFLVPVMEEIIHRSYVLGGVRRLGAVAAIGVSALVFMAFHRYSGWPFALYAGVILGVQYWHTKTVWASLVTHATVNGSIQFDWRCLNGQWNPPASDIPILPSGIIASVLLIACLGFIVILLRQLATGAHKAPR